MVHVPVSKYADHLPPYAICASFVAIYTLLDTCLGWAGLLFAKRWSRRLGTAMSLHEEGEDLRSRGGRCGEAVDQSVPSSRQID